MTDNKSPNSADRYEPENLIYSAEDEIDLIDLIKPLWQQKIFIVAITALTIAAAIVLVLRATPQYKIYTQLKPGTLYWDDKDNPVPYMNNRDLKRLITGGIFDIYATKMGLDDNIPKIKASSDRQGDQLTAYIFWSNQAEGKKIMAGFIDFLNDFDRNTSQNIRSNLQAQRRLSGKPIKNIEENTNTTNIKRQKVELNIDQKTKGPKLADLHKDRLKREIESVTADVKMTKMEVKFLEERISLAEETQTNYEKSRREIEENTAIIISLRNKLLQTPPDDNLQLLLLASTIQQNIAFLNTIGQNIEAARKEVISLRGEKAYQLKEQEKCHLAIADLHDKIDVISIIEVVEPPQASIKPLKPNKKKTVALAGVMGFFLAIIFAYFRCFWSANRDKLTTSEN